MFSSEPEELVLLSSSSNLQGCVVCLMLLTPLFRLGGDLIWVLYAYAKKIMVAIHSHGSSLSFLVCLTLLCHLYRLYTLSRGYQVLLPAMWSWHLHTGRLPILRIRGVLTLVLRHRPMCDVIFALQVGESNRSAKYDYERWIGCGVEGAGTYFKSPLHSFKIEKYSLSVLKIVQKPIICSRINEC